MHAVTVVRPGEADALTWTEVPDPELAPGEVLIEVAAAGVNRADVLQRQGRYPPPPGAPVYPGLECSGRIVDVGADVTGWAVGDYVCALLAGGGYAERVAVDAAMLLPIPAGVDIAEAAALPEAACTVWSNLFSLAGLAAGESVLIHGGASGIGTFGVQLAHVRGATVITTARAAKHAAVHDLGADVVIDYATEDFVTEVHKATDGRGVDAVLDLVGGPYLGRNIEALAPDGRLVVIAVQGGATAALDLAAMMTKRAVVAATTLRARPSEQKASIVSDVRERVWPLLGIGVIRPVIYRTMPMSEAAQAHRLLESGEHIGKIVLVR